MIYFESMNHFQKNAAHHEVNHGKGINDKSESAKRLNISAIMWFNY